MKPKNRRIKFAAAASLACLALLIGATLAYFTDRASATASGTAGTVSITLDDSALSLLNPQGVDNFNPGDGRAIAAPVTNTGNKSVDVRQTMKVTKTPASSVASFTAAPNTMGWTLYAQSDCTQDASGNWVPNASTSPIAPTSVATDATTGVITASYVLPDAVLNGTGANAETETGISTNVLSNQYVLVMLPGSDNSYQGATVDLSILAEAKQHRNTSAVAWSSLQTVSVTFGGAATDAVPAYNETSDGTTIP